jgi:hypothetical protein
MSSDSDTHSLMPAKRGTIPALWSSKNIPNKPQFYDPYDLIGDAYNRIPVADEWEIPDP